LRCYLRFFLAALQSPTEHQKAIAAARLQPLSVSPLQQRDQFINSRRETHDGMDSATPNDARHSLQT
jgi:hypothetical protein